MSIPVFRWDSIKFNRALQTTMSTQTRQAARAFVRATVVKIPVDTGQARGTFLPLGRFLRVSVPTSGAQAKPNKSVSTGAAGDKQMLFRFETNQQEVVFEIEPQLFYYWWNDFFQHNYPGGQMPTPWDSLEAGKKAFVEYMRTEAPKHLPQLKEFVTTVFFDLNANGRFGIRV